MKRYRILFATVFLGLLFLIIMPLALYLVDVSFGVRFDLWFYFLYFFVCLIVFAPRAIYKKQGPYQVATCRSAGQS